MSECCSFPFTYLPTQCTGQLFFPECWHKLELFSYPSEKGYYPYMAETCLIPTIRNFVVITQPFPSVVYTQFLPLIYGDKFRLKLRFTAANNEIKENCVWILCRVGIL